MASIFTLINKYQDCIIASVTIALGAVQAGISSWAIHRVVLDEHFLIYIFGHVMHKKTKNLNEAISHFSTLKDFLKHDLFDTLDVVKIAFSVALVSGVCQLFFSVLLFFFRKKLLIRKLWLSTSTVAFAGLVTSFGLVLKNLVQNVLYFQIFLAMTGVNFFVLFHLLASMAVDIFCGNPSSDDSKTSSTTGNSKAIPNSADSKTASPKPIDDETIAAVLAEVGLSSSTSSRSQSGLVRSVSTSMSQVNDRSRNQSASFHSTHEELPLPPPPAQGFPVSAHIG